MSILGSIPHRISFRNSFCGCNRPVSGLFVVWVVLFLLGPWDSWGSASLKQIDHQVIVTVKPAYRNAKTYSEMEQLYGVIQEKELAPGIWKSQLPTTVSTRLSQERLLADGRIRYVETDYVIYRTGVSSQPTSIPSDPLFLEQWGMHEFSQDNVGISLLAAWEIHRGVKPVVVGIIDTGIDYKHPDLQQNMWHNPKEIPSNGLDDDRNGFVDDIHGWDFSTDHWDPVDRNGHGTHVAGVVGATSNNHVGIVGIVPHVRLMALKGLGDQGFGFSSDLIQAIYYAVDNGVQVINASWGGGGYLNAMKEAIEYAAEHNVIFVAAAGNDKRNNDEQPFFPASYPNENIVAVGASDPVGGRASFSHYGEEAVDLFAPGVRILSTFLDDGYKFDQGTSMAAPHVAGSLGLLLSAVPRRDYKDYIQLLFEQTRRVPELSGLCATGGVLSVNALIAKWQFVFPDVSHNRTWRGIYSILIEE